MGESWTINSEPTKVAFIKNVERLFEEHKYITFSSPRIGPDRSIDQNSLFHMWLTIYAAHLLKKDKRDVNKGELEGMKREAKARYTAEHPDSKQWMTHTVVSPFDNKKVKLDYTSSKSWKTGEMYMVLTWLQMMAAGDGLILEAKGEFAKRQRKANG